MTITSACVALATLVGMTVPASAGGLSLGGILSAKTLTLGTHIGNGSIVVAPNVGDVAILSGNDVSILSGNSILDGSLNDILSGNGTGLDLGILPHGGGKKRRH